MIVNQYINKKNIAQKLYENLNTIALICNNKSQLHLKESKIIVQILDIDIRELLVYNKSN